MSQDLFAAFGGGPQSSDKPQASQQSAGFSFFDDVTSTTASTREPIIPVQTESAWIFQPNKCQSDDDWGDFEGPGDSFTPQSQNRGESGYSSAQAAAIPPLQNQLESSPFAELSLQPQVPKSSSIQSSQPNVGKKPTPPVNRDPNVLFDVDEDAPLEEEDDDFGDFEGPTEDTAPGSDSADLLGLADSNITLKPLSHGPFPSQISLLELEAKALESPPARLSLEQAETQAKAPNDGIQSQGRRPTSTKLSPAIQKPSNGRIVPARQPPGINLPSRTKSPTSKVDPSKNEVSGEDDEWDAWDEINSSVTPETLDDKVVKLSISTEEPAVAKDQPPPTNIPPPAVILPMFPTIFSSVETDFFKPLATQSQTARESIYRDAQTIQFLKAYLFLATVCARVIAGRKSRWKRDTLLSQSMRIGPASSGKLAGMKVTSLDRAEVAKEDREVADLLRAWQIHVGRLRAAVAEVKRVCGTDLGAVPDIREVMPIRMANELEGGVRSTKPCALCGLKREERVDKVDFEVQDSFGEWWIHNANMHRGNCGYILVMISLTSWQPVGISGMSTSENLGRDEIKGRLHFSGQQLLSAP
jgi:hypothetical protein